MILYSFIFLSLVFEGKLAQRYNIGEQSTFQLPRPFVISTTLDVGKPNNKSDLKHIMKSETSKINFASLQNVRSGMDKFYNFQNSTLDDFININPVRTTSPKMNFYSLNCAAGHRCTAIIPGPKNPVPTSKPRTVEELKNYLRERGLENGFNYSDNDRVNRHNVVARFFQENKEKKRKERDAKYSRKISPSVYDSHDFWPGSQYRPKNNNKPELKIYKWGISSMPKSHAFSDSRRDSSVISRENYFDGIKESYELPSPKFSNKNNNARINPPADMYYSSSKNNGVWNRYASSVVSQYDKNTNDWVKISSSNTKLGSGILNTNYQRPITQITKGPAFGLSVLGLPDADSYSYKRPSKPFYGDKYSPSRPTQSHYFQTPDRPFPPSKSPSESSVSLPLNIIPPNSSSPTLVYTNNNKYTNHFIYSKYNKTMSPNIINSTSTSSSTPISTPSLSYLPPLLSTNLTTTVKPKPTRKVTRRPVPTQRIIRPTQSSNTNQVMGGGGGDEGGGGGIVTNAYAVMAAVGAGLLPASIAAILPVLLGRRRKRSSEGHIEDPSFLTLLQSKSPPDPILNLLLRRNSSQTQILR